MSSDLGAGALRRLYTRLLTTAVVVIALDQITKSLALDRLQDGEEVLIDGVLRFRLAFNSGGAFGVLQGLPELFLIASLVAAVLILFWVRSIGEPSWAIPLGLVLGGGLGNVWDRIFRDTGGRVVDFIDLYAWPTFNVADACIVTGIGLVLFLGARDERRAKRAEARSDEGSRD